MTLKQKIYLETTVIAAYFDFWGDAPEQKNFTLRFWSEILPEYEPVISHLVRAELQKKQEWWPEYEPLIRNVMTLPNLPEADRLAREYIDRGIIPAGKFADALHLATACVNTTDYLATWNFEHLSRPHKRHQINETNKILGVYTPTIVEPKDFF